ncbi:MAG: 2-hydroxyacyl-CoA dehydratase [Firmicutes bacterium]|nr:2-hydroxyacyl-CoA dehydratase [Bacillota bacterium]
MRPRIMETFEGLRQQNVLTVKEAKETGKKIVGMYCVFSPQELVVAAGAMPVTLCGTKQDPIPAAEKVLPRNLCPLIKSSYGFAITDTCPYFHFADLVIAETTCDGKKKMYELMQRIKPMHVLSLPQGGGENELKWWRNELNRLKERLEEEFAVSITEEKIRAAIALVNEERRVMKELHALNRLRPAPLSGRDLLLALWMKGFNVNKEDGIALIRQLIAEVKEIIASKQSPFQPDTPRILITGCPIGIGSEKVIQIVEDSGGAVVGLENCSGYRSLHTLVDEDPDKDPLLALAEKYLQTPCSCLSPNPGRLELLTELIRDYAVDGVIDLTWQACHTFNIESFLVREHVKDKLGIPFLQIETDYSTADIQSLKLRISAFLEMIKSSS